MMESKSIEQAVSNTTVSLKVVDAVASAGNSKELEPRLNIETAEIVPTCKEKGSIFDPHAEDPLSISAPSCSFTEPIVQCSVANQNFPEGDQLGKDAAMQFGSPSEGGQKESIEKQELKGSIHNDGDIYCPKEQVGQLLMERIMFDELLMRDDEPLAKKQKTSIYTKDEGPSLYMVKGELVTPPLITKNLPAEFASFPIFGRPKNRDEFPQFCKDKIKDFMGHDLTDEEFENLSKYCSPSHLKTGVEITMPTSFPTHGFVSTKLGEKVALEKAGSTDGVNLCIQKKLQLRIEKDVNNMFPLKLKYRGIRMIPLVEDEKSTPTVMIGKPLEPGKDLIFRIRVYRPYAYNLKYFKGRTRHSVFSCDIVMVGRQKLSLLRDRIVCANDVGMRVDVSNNPDEVPSTSAKDVFPSGFLFINNVFYVDTRPGCSDHTAGLRAWAARRGLGDFAVRDMCAVQLDEIVIKLGHPEVYMHQGNCEHLFTFSEVRLMGPLDPVRLSSYPAHTSVSQHQSVYCTTCAEFGAKWIVVSCERVPFDPAFFCDTCFKLYLYCDGRKIGRFKAYSYRGNELNMLKPQG